MAIAANTNLPIQQYLQEMELWLNADIKTYINLFSIAVSRNPNDFTHAPGVVYSPTLPLQPAGYLSIPLASAILSSMEFCGFCLRGNFKRYSQSTKNIKKFYKEINGLISGTKPNGTDIKRLIQSCRHGFAHKFFPKHQIGVGYLDYTDKLFESNSLGYVLNTHALINHVQLGMLHILNSPHLFPSMQACYDDYINQVENGAIVSVPLSIWNKIRNHFRNIF